MTNRVIDAELVLAQYQAGWRICDIKRQHGISWDRLKKIVLASGAQLRVGPRTGDPKPVSTRKTAHVCAVCGKPIKVNESWCDAGQGVRHMRDCQTQTLEDARRYSFIREIGLYQTRVDA